ncbi:MAG: protein kinase family protein [Streptomyces sp.]|nr:protein kinase family protein [Streptomyces sp.]
MADRSTAAVDSEAASGKQPESEAEVSALETDAEQLDAPPKDASRDNAPMETGPREDTSQKASPDTSPEVSPPQETTEGSTGSPSDADAGGTQLELHSGHKLADRYRLEECLTRLDGFSSWRAVDEKLRRAVGVHVLPATHPRARPVLAAARSAALLGDPRFIQVLDAVEEDPFVYVVHEWLPDATELSTLLTSGQPLEPHDAYQLVSQISQAMAAAHREGLAHLRLTPSSVLRTSSGQYRIRGLAVLAALRGIDSERPKLTDTEAIGALLYAALTGRWPYEDDAYGLTALPKQVGLIAPDQVRAGVHRGLSELAMRARANDGATPSRLESPFTTPEELAEAVAAMPRIRPPEPAYVPPAPWAGSTTYQQGTYARNGSPGAPPRRPVPQPTVPPTLPGRTGKAVKWGVSALLIAALALGSWQLADTLMNRGTRSDDSGQSPSQTHHRPPQGGQPVKIVGAKDFDPLGDNTESPSSVPKAIDGDPATAWMTKWYTSSKFGNLKSGVGLIVDLGKAKQVGSVKVDFLGDTTVEGMAAPRSTGDMPTSLSGFSRFARGSGGNVTLKPKSPVVTRYVLLWLTELPRTDQGNYRARISDVEVKS